MSRAGMIIDESFERNMRMYGSPNPRMISKSITKEQVADVVYDVMENLKGRHLIRFEVRPSKNSNDLWDVEYRVLD